jgi:hypothetical protein
MRCGCMGAMVLGREYSPRIPANTAPLGRHPLKRGRWLPISANSGTGLVLASRGVRWFWALDIRRIITRGYFTVVPRLLLSCRVSDSEPVLCLFGSWYSCALHMAFQRPLDAVLHPLDVNIGWNSGLEDEQS